jgi:hypothetical protein
MVPLPPTSGSDVVRVLTHVGFVRIQRGGPVVRLERGYRSVVAIDTSDLMSPEDIRALLHEADVPTSVFLELLDRIAQEHAG